MPTTYKQVQVILDPPAVKITLANPPQNVIDIPMMEELAEALKQLEPQPEVSTIIFSGSEQSFSAGVDVAAHTPDKVREMLVKFHAVIRAIVNAKKVTIAVVCANCVAGVARLANFWEMVCTARNAHGAFPEINV